MGDERIVLPAMGARARLGYFAARLPISIFGAALAFHAAIVLFSLGAGVVYSWLNPPVTSLMVERFLDRGYVPRPVVFIPLSQLPADVPGMYLKLEDKNFYRHPGIDPAAIVHAYRMNRRWGRVIMGGSTITQQLVRTLFLSPDRNYLRKYTEAIAAVSLDAVLDKKRILELYLNYIEWGKGVYGLGAAARAYYKKPAARLTYNDYARLAAIIIDPVDYNVNDFARQPAMAARYYTLTAPPPAVEPEANQIQSDSPPASDGTAAPAETQSGTESSPSASPSSDTTQAATPQPEAASPPQATPPENDESQPAEQPVATASSPAPVN
ncbi:MAG: transglycosylase domain-containing protein [Spirochaetales bacterium]|nr:transglycosylase domain-containing protein [Spirochaetales bacterium]